MYLLSIGRWALCKDQDPAIAFSTSSVFGYSDTNGYDTNLFLTQHVALTGNTYFYGRYMYAGNTAERIFVSKLDSYDRIDWNMVYPNTAAIFFGFDVTPNDEFIFFISSENADFKLFKVDTNDGSIINVYVNSNFEPDDRTTLLKVSPNSDYVYFHSKYRDTGFIKHRLWKVTIGDETNLKCIDTLSVVNYVSITPLNSNELILTSLVSSNKLGVRRSTFSETGITDTLWSFAISTNSLDWEYNVVYVNSDSAYFLVSIDGIKLFMEVDITTGSITTKQTWAGGCEIGYSENAYAIGEYLYMVTFWQGDFILEYDMQNHVFVNKHTSKYPADFGITDIYVKNERLFVVGDTIETGKADLMYITSSDVGNINMVKMPDGTTNLFTSSSTPFMTDVIAGTYSENTYSPSDTSYTYPFSTMTNPLSTPHNLSYVSHNLWVFTTSLEVSYQNK